MLWAFWVNASDNTWATQLFIWFHPNTIYSRNSNPTHSDLLQAHLFGLTKSFHHKNRISIFKQNLKRFRVRLRIIAQQLFYLTSKHETCQINISCLLATNILKKKYNVLTYQRVFSKKLFVITVERSCWIIIVITVSWQGLCLGAKITLLDSEYLWTHIQTLRNYLM